MKRAFTLVKVLIVVAILGILAAIVVPQFQSHSQEAKEAAAKDNLRILRNAIELYATQHNDVPPGYTDDNPNNIFVTALNFYNQIVFEGHYLSKMPENPLSGDARIHILGDNATFPVDAGVDTGWIYQPATKTIRLNSQGTDKNGLRYYDYLQRLICFRLLSEDNSLYRVIIRVERKLKRFRPPYSRFSKSEPFCLPHLRIF